MGLSRLARTTALGALAVSVSVAGATPVALTTAAGAPRAALVAPGTPAALRLAVRAVGGAEDLRDLRGLRYVARGQRWIHDEGVRPGGAAVPADTFRAVVRQALRTQAAPMRLRVDSVRTSRDTAREVHEVIAGRRGYIRGVDANGSTPATKAMTSDRWAAIRAQQTLLSPHLLLRQALRNPAMARGGGTQTLGGQTYRVLVLRPRVAPVRVFVDPRTGRIARLRTLQHDYLRRDVMIEVRYARWTRAGSGLRMPRTVAIWSDGERIHRETRSAVAANPTLRARAFRIPASVGPTPFSPRLARVGARTSEWVMSFAHLGFIKDGGQQAINPQRVSPGVILLGGVANNSLVVRRDSGVVVLEGAVHDLRAEAVRRFVRQRFPGLRISHVVTTHHHADHSGGMRPYVATGAEAVVHRAAVPFFRRVFAERDTTLLPDRLDRFTRDERPAQITPVPAGGLVLGDSVRQVEVYPIQTTHAVDMTVTFVREGGVVFVSDIYTPGAPPGDGGQALNDLIVAEGLDVEWIAGGHGGVISYADFLADLNG